MRSGLFVDGQQAVEKAVEKSCWAERWELMHAGRPRSPVDKLRLQPLLAAAAAAGSGSGSKLLEETGAGRECDAFEEQLAWCAFSLSLSLSLSLFLAC